MSTFTEAIITFARKSRPAIAFGLAAEHADIIASLEKGKEFADITIVGPESLKEIDGFTNVRVANPERRLAEMLVNGEVDGMIRGTVDDFTTYEAYQELSGTKAVFEPAVMEDAKGRQFFLSPVSNPEGWDKETRLKIAVETAHFLEQWNIVPEVAIFSGTRHETYARKKNIREGVTGMLNQTYEDAEWIAAELEQQGIAAKHWAIDLNPAIEAGANVLIPVNGMVGNQIFRALFVSGGKILAAPRMGMPHCYEDNSRTETDYLPHVQWLAAWINAAKK